MTVLPECNATRGHLGQSETVEGLEDAVLGNDLVGAEQALRAGDSPDATNQHGVPLLACAALCGHEEMTRLLLAEGADPDARTSYGQTCLMLAVTLPVATTVRLLLNAGANVNAVGPDGETPILCAVLSAETSPEVVAALVEAGADLSVRDRGYFKTPLQWAEAGGQADLVAVLRAAS